MCLCNALLSAFKLCSTIVVQVSLCAMSFVTCMVCMLLFIVLCEGPFVKSWAHSTIEGVSCVWRQVLCLIKVVTLRESMFVGA